jgi:aminoglycoside 6'-N-acetyltransferase
MTCRAFAGGSARPRSRVGGEFRKKSSKSCAPADLSDPRMTMRIVSFKGRAFAYAQDYEVHAWPQDHLGPLAQGSRAINSFIGPPSMIGCGHGSAYLRLLAEQLCAEGAPLVAIDPAIDNLRARRAYEKAGFRPDGPVTTAAGPAVLMIYDPQVVRQFAFASPPLSAPTMPVGAK